MSELPPETPYLRLANADPTDLRPRLAVIQTGPMNITPSQIRKVDLPRSFRGFDETATRKLLGEAAKALEQALTDREVADRQLEDAKAAAAAAPPPSPAPTPANEAEALGTALLTAQRLGERLLDEAREEAARITSEAEAKGHEILGRAELEARNKVGELAGHVDALRRSEKELAAALDARRQLVVRYVRQVGEQLSELARAAGSPAVGAGSQPAELDRTLHTRAELTVPPPDPA